jgi:hypothetical protein
VYYHPIPRYYSPMMLYDAISRYTSSTLFPSRGPRYRPHDDVSCGTAGNRGMVSN